VIFEVGLSEDFVGPRGELVWGPDLGVGPLEAAPDLVSWRILAGSRQRIEARHVAEVDGLVLLAARLPADAFAAGAPRLAVVGRHGVGYDAVDVEACTANDVALFTTPASSRHPVAAAALAFVLALSRRVLEKDRIVRRGRWSERATIVGHEIQARTLGIVGLGNIGRELVRLVAPFEMRVLAHDPYLAPARAPPGVELVPLDELLRRADFVSLHCPLTEQTRHLIDARALALMKPEAYLINLARGPIVDGAALHDALAGRRIAGAALDVFDPEPPRPDDRLLALDNVLLSPHTAAVSVEGFRDATLLDCAGMLKAARGEVPDDVVNRAVLDRPGFQAKLARFRAAP
jgi:phosphoglycerate dehydrogenase-like enzyme